MRVTVPRKLALAERLLASSWVRMTVNGSDPVFVRVRQPLSSRTTSLGLPRRLFAGLGSQAVDVFFESAEPWRARDVKKTGFDWLPHVDCDRYFPTETAGRLVLHSRHESPFSINRVTSTERTYRLLGLYQAEGGTSDTCLECSLTNSNPVLLRFAVELFAEWGVTPDRLALSIVRARDEPAGIARARYETVGAPIAHERARTEPGNSVAILHVRKSMPLLRLVRSALVQIYADGFPSAPGACEYALGWLDGDGSVLHRKVPRLVLAGYEDEHAVVQRALGQALSWRIKASSAYKGTDLGTYIPLRAEETLQLLDVGAFRFSMSRVRLLLALGSRTEKLATVVASGARGERLIGCGFMNQRSELTKLGRLVLDGRKRYERAIERARWLEQERPELFGKKGVPYPAEMEGL
jgi:hypothetical protein